MMRYRQKIGGNGGHFEFMLSRSYERIQRWNDCYQHIPWPWKHGCRHQNEAPTCVIWWDIAILGRNVVHFEFMQIRYCSTSLILVDFWNIVFDTIPKCLQVVSFLLQFVSGEAILFHIFTALYLSEQVIRWKKSKKGNLHLTENRLLRNEMCCTVDNHNFMYHICTKGF